MVLTAATELLSAVLVYTHQYLDKQKFLQQDGKLILNYLRLSVNLHCLPKTGKTERTSSNPVQGVGLSDGGCSNYRNQDLTIPVRPLLNMAIVCPEATEAAPATRQFVWGFLSARGFPSLSVL